MLAALAFITVGIGLKLALFPLHQWLPNAYAYAPSMATAFLAATATKVSVYVLLRYYFTVFDPTALFQRLPTREVFVALSVAAMVTASLVAVFERDVKRLFAYSSVAQIGYITLGIGLDNEPGLTGAITHLLNHGITKGAIFVLLGGVALRAGAMSTSVASLAGLGQRMPLTAFGLVIAGLSLIGIPGTAGFVSKWYLILGALERGSRIRAGCRRQKRRSWSPTREPSSSNPSPCTPARSPRRRLPPNSSTTASRARTKKPSACSTT